MEPSKMTLFLILTVLVLMLDSVRGIFFGDEEPHVSKIRIHVFQPPPKIKAPKVVKHVHFNIQKPKPLKEEVLHPHEITIPITISPSIFPQEHHHHGASHHQHHAGFSQAYAQGYAETNNILLGSSGSQTPQDQGLQYDLPQYPDDVQQPAFSQQQQPDYGNLMYAMPNVQYADELPYDMQAQYADDVMYNGATGPTARAVGGGSKYPQQYPLSAITGVNYKSLQQPQQQQQPQKQRPQPIAYQEIKYPW